MKLSDVFWTRHALMQSVNAAILQGRAGAAYALTIALVRLMAEHPVKP